MELIDIMRNEKRYDFLVKAWIKSTEEMIRKEMRKENTVEALFYFLTVKGSKVDLEVVPAGRFFDSNEHKEMIAHIVRMKCRSQPVLAIVFACEAWVTQRNIKDDSEIKRIIDEGVCNQPDRMECVIVNKETRTGQQVDIYEIDEKDGKREIGKLQQTTKNVEGRFVNLLYNPKFNN